MKIQKNSNINFKANLITKATRYYSSKRVAKSETIEFLKLNKTDLPFMEKCHNLLSKYNRKDLPPMQKRLQSFLESFVSEKACLTKDYYLAIKDNNIISGGIVSLPLAEKVFVLDAFSIYPKSYNMDILTYGFFSSIQDEYPVYTIETNDCIDRFKNKKTEIRTSRIRELKSDIRKLYINTHFEKEKGQDVDLDEVFNTENFDTHINPHLL